MKTRAAASFLAFGLIIALSCFYFSSMGLRFRGPAERTSITMDVADINGLVVGSGVQLRGVSIGEVTKITTTLSGATVDFYMDKRFAIPVDSDIRLENLSALGEAYVGLIPRQDGGPVLRNGDHIAAKAVTQPPSISDLASSVVRILQQMDPHALGQIVDEMNAAFPDPVTTLPNLTRTSILLRDTVESMDGKGRELLDNFQSLLRNAEFVGPVLADTAPSILRMGVGTGHLMNGLYKAVDIGGAQMYHNMAHLLLRFEHFLDHSKGDIKVLTQSMLPYLNDISGALMNLDTGQVFNNMLAAVPEDGAVTLHVTVPEN